MKKNAFFTLIVLSILLLCAAGATYYYKKVPHDAKNSEAQKSLQATEEQAFTDLQGNPFTFDPYKGKVRVVNSWASWTPFSVQELADFDTLAGEYKDKNIAVIAIDRKESKELAQYFLSTIKNFEHVIFAIDTTDSFYASIGGYAMPETVFYDAKGNITFHKQGVMTLEEMRTHTEEALSANK